jgi:hypothetical protein
MSSSDFILKVKESLSKLHEKPNQKQIIDDVVNWFDKYLSDKTQYNLEMYEILIQLFISSYGNILIERRIAELLKRFLTLSNQIFLDEFYELGRILVILGDSFTSKIENFTYALKFPMSSLKLNFPSWTLSIKNHSQLQSIFKCWILSSYFIIKSDISFTLFNVKLFFPVIRAIIDILSQVKRFSTLMFECIDALMALQPYCNHNEIDEIIISLDNLFHVVLIDDDISNRKIQTSLLKKVTENISYLFDISQVMNNDMFQRLSTTIKNNQYTTDPLLYYKLTYLRTIGFQYLNNCNSIDFFDLVQVSCQSPTATHMLNCGLIETLSGSTKECNYFLKWFQTLTSTVQEYFRHKRKLDNDEKSIEFSDLHPIKKEKIQKNKKIADTKQIISSTKKDKSTSILPNGVPAIYSQIINELISENKGGSGDVTSYGTSLPISPGM